MRTKITAPQGLKPHPLSLESAKPKGLASPEATTDTVSQAFGRAPSFAHFTEGERTNFYTKIELPD